MDLTLDLENPIVTVINFKRQPILNHPNRVIDRLKVHLRLKLPISFNLSFRRHHIETLLTFHPAIPHLTVTPVKQCNFLAHVLFQVPFLKRKVDLVLRQLEDGLFNHCGDEEAELVMGVDFVRDRLCDFSDVVGAEFEGEIPSLARRDD